MKDNIRHTELDIAKGLGIFFMILVHVSLEFCPNTNRIILYLGRFPAAPLFMFALGAGIVFSRHNSARELVHRGIFLFAFSYLYNFFAYVIPHLLMYYYDGTVSSLLTGLNECLPNLLAVDILQFGGLAFLYFGLIKKLKLNDWIFALISTLISIIGTVLRFTTSIEGSIAQALAGLFWGTSPDISFFPFASWILFPTAGYLFAKYVLQKCPNKEKMYLFTGLINGFMYIALSIIAILLNIQFANFGRLDKTAAEYYHMHFIGNICVLSFLLAWISICYYVSKILPPHMISILQRWSKHITPIYVMHLTIINYLIYFIPNELSVCETVSLSLALLAVTDLLTKYFHNNGIKSIDNSAI